MKLLSMLAIVSLFLLENPNLTGFLAFLTAAAVSLSLSPVSSLIPSLSVLRAEVLTSELLRHSWVSEARDPARAAVLFRAARERSHLKYHIYNDIIIYVMI